MLDKLINAFEQNWIGRLRERRWSNTLAAGFTQRLRPQGCLKGGGQGVGANVARVLHSGVIAWLRALTAKRESPCLAVCGFPPATSARRRLGTDTRKAWKARASWARRRRGERDSQTCRGTYHEKRGAAKATRKAPREALQKGTVGDEHYERRYEQCYRRSRER